ncbi:MAG: pilus assembly protein PilM [bacterium]
MGIFNSTQKSYLGIDLGAVSTKVVELGNEKGRPRLVTYGFVEEAVDLARNDSPEAKEKIIAFLKEICKKAGVKTNKAIAALPTFSVFSSIVSLPRVAKKDLPSTIRWEAKKVIPMPLEEMILDWKILPETEPVSNLPADRQAGPVVERVIKTKNGSQYLKVLLTGAPKNLVKKFMEVFNGAGLQLISLETESFALVRSLVGEDKSTIMIIDLGGATTNLSVIDKGVPVLNRSLEIGGSTITRAIADGLNINLVRAEQFKRDMGISLGSRGQNDVPQTIEASVAPIINEIKYCFGLYQNQALRPFDSQFSRNGDNASPAGSSEALFNGRIEKIILTGGSALLPNLADYLSKLLDIKVYLGDPWARIIYPIELRPILEEIGSRFSVALGLAMRDIE